MSTTKPTAVSNTAVENYSRKPRIVASRPDYLTLSLPDKSQDYLPDLLASFGALFVDAPSASIQLRYDFFGAALYLQRDGKGLPRLVAKDMCELRFYTTGGRVSAQFTVYSAPFWMDDAQAVFAYAWGLICEICGREVSPVPVRLDLARDVQGFNLDKLNSIPALHRNFVTRSRKRRAQTTVANDEYLIAGASTVESVYLGSPSAPVRWNIYDKSLQAARSGKTYYQPVWEQAAKFDQAARIVRFEARLTGRVWQELARHGVKNGLPPLTLENLHEWLTPLWSWLTQSHTRMVVWDAQQTNRSRLKTSAFWSMMGQAFDDDTTCVPLQRERVRNPGREALGAQSEGALLSLAAMTPQAETWGASEIGGAVLDLVGWRCGKVGMTWRARVLERRALLAVS